LDEDGITMHQQSYGRSMNDDEIDRIINVLSSSHLEFLKKDIIDGEEQST
jgi:hypothetical protein